MDLKIKDVAELLNVSESTIHRWLKDGRIPAYKINQQYHFSRAEIEDWVIRHGQGMSDNQDDKEDPNSFLGNKQFSLYRALHKGTYLNKVKGNTKEEIIRTSMKKVADSMNLDSEVVTDLLLEREKLQPTSLNNGIGIPHTRDLLLNTHFDIVHVVYSEQPIPYGALDGKPVHTFLFLFACDDKRHLHLLAKIAHLCSNQNAIEFLKSKPDRNSLLNYVKDWEAKMHHAAAG